MSEPLSPSALSKELAQIAMTLQAERTGHTPKAVIVVASEETVVLTLHEALTPAEKILARTESGAAKVEQYHRALFAVSCDELRKEIQRLTGRKVREAAVVVEPATGAIVHAFTSGTVVQIFQLEPDGVATHVSAGIPSTGDETLN
ncbi:MAG: Na-translocating system protein MpsC family protein [Planctomycetota bacterium]